MDFTDLELKMARSVLKKAMNADFDSLPRIEQLELLVRLYRHKFHALLDDGPEKTVFTVRSLLIDRDGIATVTGELDGQPTSLVLSRTDSDNVHKIELSKMNHVCDCDVNGRKFLMIFDTNTQLE